MFVAVEETCRSRYIGSAVPADSAPAVVSMHHIQKEPGRSKERQHPCSDESIDKPCRQSIPKEMLHHVQNIRDLHVTLLL
ncbi:hypothetical protein TNIN_437981 [Trichonephila inaurata madagascariensis]|uniref:Uncharacterized protein n=1 Tax=Trichonephila inaurata madagascariensis TaxID=2747483 RepID=A0A8X6XGU1_9ARAC|nr:hypothetical protein TNIN_437981 [Trichonephila inaurata madagascariensis]